MKIEFIHHSSVYIELSKHVLIFDYVNGENEKFKFEGTLPKLPEDKDIYFFFSHAHEDHFDKSVVDIQKSNEKVFIAADKTCGLGSAPGLFEKVFKKKALKVDFGRKYKYNDLDIETLKSTEQGVAFVVTCEDKKIYFAGDLALWYWDGVGDLINGRETSAYKHEMSKINDMHFEAAFVPLDPRMGAHAGDSLMRFMENNDCDFIVPIGTWNDFSAVEVFKKKCSNGAFAARVCDLTHVNEILKND